jgi:hypothetical protein
MQELREFNISEDEVRAMMRFWLLI